MRIADMPNVRHRYDIVRRVCLLALLGACQNSSDSLAPLNPPPHDTTAQTIAIQERLAFVSTRDGSPYIYIGDSTGIKCLTSGLKPSWSPDGRRIAFHRVNAGVFVINVDGSDERLLVANGWNPAWSPDGRRIAFNTGSGVAGGVLVMNADGSGIAQLVSSDFVFPGDWIGLAAWSPNGRDIAFVRANFDEPWQTYIVSADGGAPRALFDGNFIPSQSEPSWSPDGTMLAIESFSSIARVRAGVAQLLVHGTAGRAYDPDWSPDGASLVFNRFSGPPEADNAFGSRMRIYLASAEGGPVRQLIPEAIAPALPNYWDHQAAWLRMTRLDVSSGATNPSYVDYQPSWGKAK